MIPLLLLLPLAWADPASDLRALDAQVAALTPPPSLDGLALTDWVKASSATLLALKDGALAAAEGASPGQRSRVHLRLADGSQRFAQALADSPCPSSLDSSTCAKFKGALAEQAARLLPLARQSLEQAQTEAFAAEAGPEPLSRKERKQLGAVERRLALTEARLPPPPPPRPAQPPPERFGAPAALPADWTVAQKPAQRDQDALPDPTSDFVLVDKGAWLSARKDGGGSRGRAGPALREDGVPEPMLARLVRMDGDRALLELGAGDHRYHCFFDPPWDRAWRVRMWVDKAALQRVTTKPVARSFPDGSGVALRPGVLVTDDGLWADGALLPIDLTPIELGWSYQESAQFPTAYARVGLLTADTRLSLGGQPLTRPPVDWRGSPERDIQRLEVGPDGRQRVGLDSSCGQITLLAEGRERDAVGAVLLGGGEGGVIGGTVGGGPTLHVVAGTPLWWEDGGLAGVLTEGRYLQTKSFPLEPDGRRCMDRSFDGLDEGEADRPDRHLKLCVKPTP